LTSSLDSLGTTVPRLLAFVVGACFGSFLNVCVARWPHDESVVSPRSHCPRCGHEITWYENIPLLSWIALRARCRGCKEPISVVYPLVELVVALGWLAAVVQFGPSFTALRVAIFGTVLLGIMLTDAAHYVIPDGFTVFGLFWALAAAIAAFLLDQTALFAGIKEAVLGACVGAGLIAIVGWLGEVALKREAMGFGDVTLMAMVGAYVGPGRAMLTVFLGALLGVVIFVPLGYLVAWIRRDRDGAQLELSLGKRGLRMPQVPFGVFLAPAAMIALLWGPQLISWYLDHLAPGLREL
jgi:leader peptidase (prepilin peptidase) / N-methyltransferase